MHHCIFKLLTVLSLIPSSSLHTHSLSFSVNKPQQWQIQDFSDRGCRAIKQGMVIVNTWVFILRRYKWHIHAGSWSLVNCLAGSLDEALYRVLMNINECGCRPYGWLGLDGNRCIRVIPRHPPFSIKKRLCLHAKKLLLEIYYGP